MGFWDKSYTSQDYNFYRYVYRVQVLVQENVITILSKWQTQEIKFVSKIINKYYFDIFNLRSMLNNFLKNYTTFVV